MDKRNFIRTSLLTLGAAAASRLGWAASYKPLPSQPEPEPLAQPLAGPFALPALPYATAALQPHIDERTMMIHHQRHHQGYTDNLNKAIAGTPHEKKSIEQILALGAKLPAALRNNGGGYYNHSLFWTLLQGNGPQQPQGQLGQAIDRDFGSYSAFQEAFAKAGMGQFGSGWAWLVVSEKGKLSVGATANQDNPLMKLPGALHGSPVLALDVWEHAYYLNYQNKRGDYIKAFWQVANWRRAEELFDAAVKK